MHEDLINLEPSDDVVFVTVNEGSVTESAYTSVEDDLLISFDPLHDTFTSEHTEPTTEALLSEPEPGSLSEDQRSHLREDLPSLHESSITIHEQFNDSDDGASSSVPLN